MCTGFEAAMIGTAVAGLGMGAKQAQSASKKQEEAMAQAERQATETKAQADQAFNAANKKKPNIANLDAANQNAGAAGVGSTMLTGPSGVDPSSLSLGRNTLLGG